METVEWETNQSLFPLDPKSQVRPSEGQCFPHCCHHYRKHIQNFDGSYQVHSIHHISMFKIWADQIILKQLRILLLLLFHNIYIATAATMTTVKFDHNAVNAKLCAPLPLFGYLCGVAAEKDFILLLSRPALHCTRFCEKDDLEVECEALFRSFTKFDLHI